MRWTKPEEMGTLGRAAVLPTPNPLELLLGLSPTPGVHGSPDPRLSRQRHLGCAATPTTPFLDCLGHC